METEYVLSVKSDFSEELYVEIELAVVLQSNLVDFFKMITFDL